MNIFYASKKQVLGDVIELTGQEARHAAKVLRYREGDSIAIVDGEGGWYSCVIGQISKSHVKATVREQKKIPQPLPFKIAAFGVIKKRDRLEFAVEKAVELGASEIALFRSRHSVKQNVRLDRLEATALAAMKQSLRARLPEVKLFDSLEQLLQDYAESTMLLAHKTDKEPDLLLDLKEEKKLLVLVGPEGGFSEEELGLAGEHGARVISLGEYRLRAETAVVTLLSRLL